VVGGDVVGVVVDSDKAGVADPPQADVNSMTVIIDKEQKSTNLCWSLIKSLIRISLPPGPWLG
jgi:hypothetical protein